jgi:hypothetical protein
MSPQRGKITDGDAPADKSAPPSPPERPSSSSLLGWQPEQPGLIADIDHPAYFAQ